VFECAARFPCLVFCSLAIFSMLRHDVLLFSFTEHFYPDCPLLYGSCVCDSGSGESMSGKDGRGDFGVEGDGVKRGTGL